MINSEKQEAAFASHQTLDHVFNPLRWRALRLSQWCRDEPKCTKLENLNPSVKRKDSRSKDGLRLHQRCRLHQVHLRQQVNYEDQNILFQCHFCSGMFLSYSWKRTQKMRRTSWSWQKSLSKLNFSRYTSVDKPIVDHSTAPCTIAMHWL